MGASLVQHVFINCPFDPQYQSLFEAIVFTVSVCGLRPRCALEEEDGSQIRIEKIFNIISTCRFGIHDISKTELDEVNFLPRFNMPLELGIFLGAKRFGAGEQKDKTCLILDREKYRYQKFISDIAGQDIRAHGDDPKEAISIVRIGFGVPCPRSAFLGVKQSETIMSSSAESFPRSAVAYGFRPTGSPLPTISGSSQCGSTKTRR
jgi:hypothetical protein